MKHRERSLSVTIGTGQSVKTGTPARHSLDERLKNLAREIARASARRGFGEDLPSGALSGDPYNDTSKINGVDSRIK